MTRIVFALIAMVCVSTFVMGQESGTPSFSPTIVSIVETHCGSCHAEENSEGDFSLSQISGRVDEQRDIELLRMLQERVKYHEMPPPTAKQMSASDRRELLNWIRDQLLATAQPDHWMRDQMSLPKFGNYVDHAALFHNESLLVVPGPPRLWRLRPQIYTQQFIGETQLNNPFGSPSHRDFNDYAAQRFIDEATAGMLLDNAESIVQTRSKSVLATLTSEDKPPQDATIVKAIRETFLSVLFRQPTVAESDQFSELYHQVVKTSGRNLAAERMLIAIYVQPAALFREELGVESVDPDRVRLSQSEVALAISYALANRADPLLLQAAKRNELATREHVLTHVQRRLDSPQHLEDNPRILEFFREYFGYARAAEVFKTDPERGSHMPHALVNDLDMLIGQIVQEDREVLSKLLTTNEYFVDCGRDPRTGALVRSTTHPESKDSLPKSRNAEYAAIYGLSRDWIWTDQQPVALPGSRRAGVLTHPAWLVAWSSNFENQPVQRGKWIRTHLLGGTVPDVPIGVDATIPKAHDKQFRERISMATSGHHCQRCHRKMDPLGMPLEQYDHYGRFRLSESRRPVDTSGTVSHIDDKSLLGDLRDPIQLMHRLAKSAHVEQVFVRHVFRYLMGRNESLGDAKTLQRAHHAYRQRGGSFRAIVESILTSDSFLYRSKTKDAQ